jgi:hypothetical protein
MAAAAVVMVLACGTAVGAAAVNPCVAAATTLLCPDLVMRAPADLVLDRTTEPGHVLLRATSALENVGAGPLDIRGFDRTGGEMRAKQEIRGRDGRWFGYLTGASLDFHFVPGDRYGEGSVAGASYWKFRHAAGFELWSVDANRQAVRLVRRGPKLDYCLRDLKRTHPTRHSPSAPVYPGCAQNPSQSRDRLGTSPGWSDVYPYGYPQQWIDVTGLRGRFAYAIGADPLGFILESNELNNWSEAIISLPSGRVLARRTRLPQP